MGCGSRIAGMFTFAYLNNLQFEGWHAFYVHRSEVLDKNAIGRRTFGLGGERVAGELHVRMMKKNVLFLLTSIALATLAWGVFHFLGLYAFLDMLVITIAALLYRVGKPKFEK